jgi:hypothetical protein
MRRKIWASRALHERSQSEPIDPADLGEQRSVYRDNAKRDRNRRSYKIEHEANQS